ncbi:MAG: TIGR02147 family protein [Pseudobdellovibrionaceae bacterium]
MNLKKTRPDVFLYHDYRLFLVDLCKYLKSTVTGFNVSKLAKDSKVSKGYLSMVLSGERKLTEAALQKLLPHLALSKVEESQLGFLCEMTHADSQIEKARAIGEMQKLRSYQKNNPKETLVYRYLSHWYHAAIREMAEIEGFQLNAKWLQTRLKEPVLLSDIEKAIEFLVENQFLIVGPDGKVSPPDTRIECIEAIHKAAMVKFHEQVFSLALEHVPKLEKEQKILNAHTTALSLESFQEIKSLLEETLTKIIQIAEKDQQPEIVFQFSLLGFALTNSVANPVTTPVEPSNE